MQSTVCLGGRHSEVPSRGITRRFKSYKRENALFQMKNFETKRILKIRGACCRWPLFEKPLLNTSVKALLLGKFGGQWIFKRAKCTEENTYHLLNFSSSPPYHKQRSDGFASQRNFKKHSPHRVELKNRLRPYRMSNTNRGEQQSQRTHEVVATSRANIFVRPSPAVS